MKEITKDESIQFLEDLSNEILFPFKFVNEIYRFRCVPSKWGIRILNIFNWLALITPHLIYFFRSYSSDEFWNLFVYILLIVVSIHVVFLLVFMLPSNELVIDNTTASIELRPQDFFGKRFKKVVQLNITDVEDVGHITIKSRSKTEIYLTLEMKNKKRYRLFAFTTWENISKIKAAFKAILFSQKVMYDDSNEKSVLFDEKISVLTKEDK